MGLTEEILEEIRERPAEDVRLGYRYTGVRIGDRIGLAYTMADRCDPPGEVGELAGKKLCSLALSDNLMESTIGVAAINAHLEPGQHTLVNAFDRILEIAPNYRRAGVVGFFPFIPDLNEMLEEVYVFEKKKIPGCLPESSGAELIPKCDLVIITGTTFINKTLEPLLELSSGYTMVIGPTTPLSRALFERGADVIAGSVTRDPKVMDVVSQGGGTREFMPMVEPVYIESN